MKNLNLILWTLLCVGSVGFGMASATEESHKHDEQVVVSYDTTASIDVHAQNTFTTICPDELPIPGATEIVSQLNAQAKKTKLRVGSKEAHNRNATWVTHHPSKQLTPIEGENVDVCWVPHSIVGTTGFNLMEGLPAPTAYDYFVWEGIELDMHPYGVLS